MIDPAARDRALAQHSFGFVLDMAGSGIAGLKTLDALLMMAINQANIAPLTRDPAARSRYGTLAAAAPDDERRPVSVRAVAASLRLPYETARRNIRRLEARGVCVVSDGGVVVPEAFLLSAPYFEAARLGHERLHALWRELDAQALLEPLPSANYDEPEPPIRGAVRLLSDYLLRTADAVVGRVGELVSTLVLLPLLTETLAEQPRPLSIAAIARRSQLPAETVRRHAAALAGSGACESSSGGLVFPSTHLADPMWQSLLRENAIDLQRMFAGLAERGVVEAWRQMAQPELALQSKGAA